MSTILSQTAGSCHIYNMRQHLYSTSILFHLFFFFSFFTNIRPNSVVRSAFSFFLGLILNDSTRYDECSSAPTKRKSRESCEQWWAANTYTQNPRTTVSIVVVWDCLRRRRRVYCICMGCLITFRSIFILITSPYISRERSYIYK